MKIFSDLKILAEDHSSALKKLTAKLPENWQRNLKREIEIGEPADFHIFTKYVDSREYASLAMYGEDDGLKVANIVPVQQLQFDKNEYNQILNEFANIAIHAGFSIKKGKETIELKDRIGEEAAKNLIQFSSAANKSTGRSHPMDERRWLRWIYSTVVGNAKIEFEELVYFLEEQGWDEESAYQLALDYEYGSEAMHYALAQARGDI